MLNYQRVEPTRVFGRSCARLVRAPGTWLPRAAVAQRVSRQRWCKANGMVAGTSAVSPLWTGSFLLGKKHVPIMVKIMVVSLPWRSREFRMRQTQSWMAFAIDWWTSEGPQTDAPNANPSNTTNSAHFFPGVQMRSIRRRPKGDALLLVRPSTVAIAGHARLLHLNHLDIIHSHITGPAISCQPAFARFSDLFLGPKSEWKIAQKSTRWIPGDTHGHGSACMTLQLEGDSVQGQDSLTGKPIVALKRSNGFSKESCHLELPGSED